MSYYDDFLKELKKRGLSIEDVVDSSSSTGSKSSSGGSSVKIGNSSFENEFKSELKKRGLTLEDAVRIGKEEQSTTRTRVWDKFDDDDIAPVRKQKEEDDSLLDFFQKGAFGNIDLRKNFKDGYQFGDGLKTAGNVGLNVGKAILGTGGDVGLGIVKGAAGLGEGIADLLTYGMSGVANLAGADEVASRFKEYAQMNKVDEWTQGANDFFDQYSVLGRTSDAILQGLGQVGVIVGTGGLGAAAGLGTAGTTALTTGTLAASGMGAGMSEAYDDDATDKEALIHGVTTGASDALWELLFGGMGKAIKAVGFSKGLSSLDDIVAKGVTKAVSNPNVRNILEFAIKSGFEGLEEVGSGFTQAVSKKLTYMSEEEFSEILKDENLLEQFIVGAATSGITQSGAIPGTYNGSLMEANKTGRDFITGFSQNEQAVIDKEVEKRIAEQEKNGKKLTGKEKSEIQDKVEADMDKGYISTDTIEEVLGGDTYKAYQDTVKSEENLVKQEKTLTEEYNKLNKMVNEKMTGEQQVRRDELRTLLPELRSKIEDQNKNSKLGELKTKLTEDVKNLVAGDRLIESYNEVERKKQAFQADLTKYDTKQHTHIKEAIESGVLNNSNKSHDVVEFTAKVEADTGIRIRYSDTQKIKEAGLYPKHTVGLQADGTQTEYDLGIQNLDENFKPVVKVGDTEVSNYTVDFKNGKITFDSAPVGDVSVTVEGTEIVNAVYTKDGIVLNVKSPKYLETLTGHELYHAIKISKLDGNLNDALKAFAEARGDYETRLKEKQAKYKGIKDADPEAEVMADLLGEYVFEGRDFIMDLATKDRNVFQKIYDEIKYLVKVATAGSKEAKRLAQVEREFEKVYRELAQKNTADSGVKYSLNSNAKTELHKALYDKNYKNEVLLRDETPAIMTSQKGVKNLPMAMNASHIRENVFTEAEAKAEGLRVDKHTHYHGLGEEFFLKVIDGLDNVKEAYRGTKNATDPSRRENYFLLVSEFTQNGNVVNVPVYVNEHAQFNRVFVDVNKISTVFGRDHFRDYIKKQVSDKNLVRIKNRSTQASEPSALIAKGYGEDASSAVNIAENQGDVKTQFSLSSSVEETKNLVALHNLTADKLSKSLELGGLPMPSLAITKADIPHSNFGDITLVFGRETIDPKANKKNKVYSADAWTPVFPRVEYEADSKVSNQISQKLREVKSKIDDTFQRDLRRIQYGFEDYLDSHGGEEGLIQLAMENYGLKAAYLEEQGKHIEKVTVQQEAKKGYNPDNAEKYQKIMDVLGVTTAEEIGKVNLKEARDNYGAELEAVYPGITKDAGRMGRLFGIVQSYLESKDSAPVYETVTDTNATRMAVDEALDSEGFEAWTRNLFAGIVKDSGIYNNKDRFTPSGNRRSFKQTHLPVTLENIVKAMASQNGGNSKNVSGFNGIKTLRAATAETFKSVADMHNRKDRLQHLTQEQADALNDELQNRLYKIIETIDSEGKRSGESNPFIRYDSIGETLSEIGESGKYNVADIQNTFRQYGKEISDDTAMQVKQLLYDVTQMPVNIFEAKPQRVVSFDEAKAFVVPNNVDAKLKQELLNRGYSIAEYDPNVEGDRQRVVNQFEEYKFSLSDAGNQPKKSGYRATLGKDVALEAPAQEVIAPVAENATTTEKSTAVEDLFPDDTAPIQEEYENLLAEREDIIGAMDAYAAVGDYASAEQLMAEYEAVQTRIAEIEADDADRFASIDDEDAPPVMEDNSPEDVADNVPLTKTLVADLAKSVRSQLGLPANRVAEVRDLIERYSAEEFPSKAHLYTEIQERFGTYTEASVDEELKGIKSLLRTYGISVDESIKAEIPDYAQMMRSNFGKVRFSKEGLPVDVAYKEFQEALPGYFPESTYVPTDQLMRIIEVANLDTTIETEYEIDSETLEAVTDTIMNGVAEFKQNRKETLANKHGKESFQSLMESADQYAPPVSWDIQPVKQVRPAIESVQSDPDDIAPVFETSSGQQALMPEVEAPKKITRSDLHYGIMDNIKTYFKNKGFDFDKVLKDAKDLSTFATVDNTPQRVLEKALGYKEGKMLSEMTVNRVARNETDGIRWLNSFTDKKSGLLAKISKQYGIKPGSKASAAAQMYAEGFYVGENEAIIAYGDKELAADFPDKKVQQNIKKLARDPRIRQIYDETLEAINKSRTRNAYPEIPRLDNYFLHFRAMEDTFSRLGLPFNPNDIRAKDLPTDLNGVTADLKPGQPYFASAMHRTGKRTSFDLLGGLEKYLTSAKNQIYHIDDIQTFRALRNYVAETYGQAHGLENLDLLSDEEAEQRIKDVYDSHLSTFAKFLNEEANVLAGKTSLIDRGLEGVIGRRGITFLNTLNGQVGANMVGFNVSSSLTNFLAPVQAFAKTNKFDFVKAMAQTVYNKMANVVGKGDNFAEESPVMIRRKGAERFYRTPYQKVADAGYVFMGVVDDISTELIARTKYNEFTRKGMSSSKAHYETDKWVSRLMGDRSLGQQPQLYNSRMLGLFTKFQLEVRNQLDSQFYDTIQEAKVSTEDIQNGLLRNAKKAAKITSTFAQLAVVQHLFGKAFESVAGYNPAFDIIEALIKTFGWDDDEEDEDTVLDNIEEGFLSLLEDLPYTSTLTGGRIPIASALPITEFIKGKDQYGNEKSRWETLGEAAPYYLLPGGYGQIKKTKAGLQMFDEDLPIAGSYTDSGNLRFPVEETPGNVLQAGLFGQWASDVARDYFDNERKPLNEKQTQELIDTDMPIRDYWDYREGLSEQENLEDKIKYIEGLDLPVSTKNILVNNVTERKNPIDLTDYDQYGDYDEFDFATKNPEKYDFLQENNIAYSDYASFDEDTKEFYDGVYSWQKNNPEKVTVSKAVTDSVVEYRQYAKDLDAIRADKDSNGKSISGSAKQKKWNYINSLNIDDGAKLILFKNEYNADDTYNYEIIDYLNRRDDITFDEMNTILRELGFNVTADGKITWD